MSIDFDQMTKEVEEASSPSLSAFYIACSRFTSNPPNKEIVDEVFDGLLRAYENPKRGHHNMQHIQECLSLLEKESRPLGVIDEDFGILALAFFFHDVIYEPEKGDNEARSAERASSELKKIGIDPVIISKVKRLILASKPGATHLLIEEKFFHDIDYAVLGSSRERYREYMAGIQKEFSGEKITFKYRIGRAIFLIKTLFSGNIFKTKGFQIKFTKQAKENIKFELLELCKLKLDVFRAFSPFFVEL